MPDTARNSLRIPFGPLEEGLFVHRPNRFLAVVSLGRKKMKAYVANPGRLEELLVPGNQVMVRRAHAPGRKTELDLVLAAFDNLWVSLDTRYPNRLFEQAAKARALKEFQDYTSVFAEVSLEKALRLIQGSGDAFARNGNTPNPKPAFASRNKTPESRFDFLLKAEGKRPLLVEVKSVSLCVKGTGLFPDAPTLRGARHLRELKEIQTLGFHTCVVFIAQRPDITKIRPNHERDPDFAQALAESVKAGVWAIAYRSTLSTQYIELERQSIPCFSY